MSFIYWICLYDDKLRDVFYLKPMGDLQSVKWSLYSDLDFEPTYNKQMFNAWQSFKTIEIIPELSSKNATPSIVKCKKNTFISQIVRMNRNETKLKQL